MFDKRFMVIYNLKFTKDRKDCDEMKQMKVVSTMNNVFIIINQASYHV